MQLKNIPVIDLSPILDKNCTNLNINLNSSKISKLVDNIRNACIDWGFFYIIGHNFEEESIRKIRAIAKDFFEQSKEFKRTAKRQPRNFHGFWEYGFEGEKKGWRETFDFGMPQKSILKHDNLSDVDSEENLWPDVEAVPKFRVGCESWITKMHSLATHLAELILLGLGTDPKIIMHHFDETKNSASCRLNFYPVCPDKVEDKFGVGAHTDYGGFTILLQDDDVNSLQVERDGHWYEVPSIPGSFVVNTGGMMQIWSNGLIKAPVHRVVTNSENNRYSVPFFFNPSYSTNVGPLESCITPDNPCRFLSVNWGKYFWSKMKGDKNNEYGEELEIHHFQIHSS